MSANNNTASHSNSPETSTITRRHPYQSYKDCQHNHAASLGGFAVDGCGEFMPSPTATSSDPTSLKCAACGCHQNFHRRESDDHFSHTHVLEFQSRKRHHPPPPRSPDSQSPPPISSSYYPSSTPGMLLALSGGVPVINARPTSAMGPPDGGRKRFRTKFSPAQKEMMQGFAEKVGWKMQRRDDEVVSIFCDQIGVDRTVFKVWMHNNKSSFIGKKDIPNNASVPESTA